jgi:hypothetical protein
VGIIREDGKLWGESVAVDSAGTIWSVDSSRRSLEPPLRGVFACRLEEKSGDSPERSITLSLRTGDEGDMFCWDSVRCC